MKHRWVTIWIVMFVLSKISSQCGLQSGPMVGSGDMLEVTVWVQTQCEQHVQLKYWESVKPETVWVSDDVLTSKDHGYCAHLVDDRVEPGKTYLYGILIDGVTVVLP